jgi:hypothetical protein
LVCDFETGRTRQMVGVAQIVKYLCRDLCSTDAGHAFRAFLHQISVRRHEILQAQGPEQPRSSEKRRTGASKSSVHTKSQSMAKADGIGEAGTEHTPTGIRRNHAYGRGGRRVRCHFGNYWEPGGCGSTGIAGGTGLEESSAVHNRARASSSALVAARKAWPEDTASRYDHYQVMRRQHRSCCGDQRFCVIFAKNDARGAQVKTSSRQRGSANYNRVAPQ